MLRAAAACSSNLLSISLFEGRPAKRSSCIARWNLSRCPLPDEAKYRIRWALEDNRRAAALQALLRELRKKAQVRNLMAEGTVVQLRSLASEGSSLGDAAAPVTVVEFTDFECPYCRGFAAGVHALMEDGRGKVRLVVRHFPLPRHPNAFEAAKAAVCAEEQQKFWDFHERAFSGRYPLTADGLARIGRDIELDGARFSTCLAAPATSAGF